MGKMGRPSDAVRARFMQILEDSHAHQRLTQILAKTKNDAIFLKAMELVMDRAHGKPNQTMEVTGIDAPTFGILSAGAISQVLDTLKKGSD